MLVGWQVEDIYLTLHGLYHGHPELLFWRYVDTDVLDDLSGGWYNMISSIISIFSLVASTFKVYQKRHQLHSVIF